MAVAVEQWLILPSLGTKLCVSFANDRLGCETQVERKVLEMAQHASFHQHVSYNLSTILHAFTAGEVCVRLPTGLVRPSPRVSISRREEERPFVFLLSESYLLYFPHVLLLFTASRLSCRGFWCTLR